MANKPGPPLVPPELRFWSKVNKTETCWLWTAKKNNMGYGLIGSRASGESRFILAHRLSWEMAHAPLLPEQRVLHTCDNPACVRPDHLFLGSQSDNMIDMARKRRSGNQFKQASLTEAREIIRRYRDGETQVQLSASFGFDQTYISRIVTGRIVHLLGAFQQADPVK